MADDLRQALRMTQEAFAHRLGISPRTVAKWRAQRDLVPTTLMQQVLDTALAQTDDGTYARFQLLSNRAGTEVA